jgi:predicted NUDIX family phosphoesterase
MEQVLVVRRELFDELGAFEGFRGDVGRYLKALMDPENNHFMTRAEAEEDPGHKQIIPYCLLVQGGRLLRYWRGASGGEARLHAKASVGIGGHINPVDAGQEHMGLPTYENAVRREIEEELELAMEWQHRAVGLINDDSNPVGQVHLGIVHLFELGEGEVRAREDGIEGLEMVEMARVMDELDVLESWSRICVEALVAEGVLRA